MKKLKGLLTVILLGLIMNCTTFIVKADVLVERFGGDDRYDTAIKIARAGWTESSNIILTYGGDFPDSISAVPLAKKYDAPILLTKKDSLSSQLIQCIEDLKVSNALIVGGTGVVSINVENTLKTMGITVQRIAGSDRYNTSLEVAKLLVDDYTIPDKDIYVVSGKDFPDALSIAPVAAAKQRPILLVSNKSISPNIESFIRNKCVKPNIYVIGGTGVISENIVSILKATNYNTISRISGINRYETNSEVLKNFFSTLKFENLDMASGENFPDALAGVAYGARNTSPLLLVSNKISDATYYFLNKYRSDLKTKKVYVFGGKGVVNDSVLENLQYIDAINNSYANYNNGGLALKLGDYIYYRSELPSSKLCRMNLDGSNVKVITDIQSGINSSITGIGNKIYFNAPQGNASVLYVNEFKPYSSTFRYNKIYIKGDKVYSSNISEIYVYDGSTGIEEEFTTGFHNELFFYLDSVYYKQASVYGSKLYKQNLNDKTIVELTQNNIYKFNIYKNEVYFIDEEDKKLYKIDLNGGNKKLVIGDQLLDLNISNGWIYYSNALDNKKLYKVKVDGTSKTKLNDIPTTSINVVDNWIFYYKEFSVNYKNELYRMKIDGTLNKQI